MTSSTTQIARRDRACSTPRRRLSMSAAMISRFADPNPAMCVKHRRARGIPWERNREPLDSRLVVRVPGRGSRARTSVHASEENLGSRACDRDSVLQLLERHCRITPTHPSVLRVHRSSLRHPVGRRSRRRRRCTRSEAEHGLKAPAPAVMRRQVQSGAVSTVCSPRVESRQRAVRPGLGDWFTRTAGRSRRRCRLGHPPG